MLSLNIPIFELRDYDKDNYKIYYTVIPDSQIENEINNIINNFDFAKYYIHCNDSFWLVSFIDINYEEMIESSIKIKL